MNKSTHWRLVASILAFYSAVVYAGFAVSSTGGKCGDEEEVQAGSNPGDGGKDNSDPIYLASGDYQRSETDLFIPGRGLDFEFKRMYRSRSSLFAESTIRGAWDITPGSTEIGQDVITNRSPLGIGWDHKYNMRIDLDQDAGVVVAQFLVPDPEPVIEQDIEPEDIYLYDGTGRLDTFSVYTTHDAVAGDPALYANNKIDSVFRYSVHNASIDMFDKDQVRYRFLPFYTASDQNAILPYAGRLQSITDRNGNQLEFFYETSNGVERLASMTDTLGHNITYLYHDDVSSPLSASHPADHVAHLLWRVIDHANRVMEFDYEDVSGDYEAKLITATLPNIEDTVDFPLQYTSAGTAIDHGRFASGRSWQYEYSPALASGWLRDGMMTKVTDPNGVVIIENKYDLDLPTEDRRAYGRVVRQKYGDEAYNYVWIDDENNLQAETSGKNYFVWVNDRRGAITRFKYARARAVYAPNDLRDMQLLEKTEFLEFVDNPDLRVFATYNKNTDQIVEWKQIDASGTVSTLSGTQPLTEITTEFIPNPKWNTAGIISPNGIVTTNTYQSEDYPPAPGDYPNPQFNRTVTSHTMSSPTGVTPVVSVTENWRYDFDFGDLGGSGCGCGSSGHYTAYKDGEGNVTRKVYDETVNALTTRANGNLLAEYRGLPVSYFSESLGANVAIDAESADEYEYNQWGQMVEHTHPTKLIINDNGVEEPHSRVDQFEYYSDASDQANYGRLKMTHVDVNGFNLTTAFEYDLIGNVIKMTSPGGEITKSLYNQSSQRVRIQRLDSSNNLFYEKMFFYDAKENMVVEEELNLDGDRNVVSENSWFTTVYIYDSLGFSIETSREKNILVGLFTDYDTITKQAMSQVLSSEYITERWSYDANRNLIKYEDGEAVSNGQASNTIVNEYDARDLRIQTIKGYGGVSELMTSYEYDENNRLVKRIASPDNPLQLQATLIEYDGIGRAIRFVDPMGNEYFYEYDDNFNIVSEVACGPILFDDEMDTQPHVTLAKISRMYDSLNRPVSQSAETYEYNYSSGTGELCGVVPVSSVSQTKNYIYNNDSSIRQTASPSAVSQTDNIILYFYDSASRLAFTEDGAGNILANTYDNNSNVISKDQYDISENHPGEQQIFVLSYVYDALERRIKMFDSVGNQTFYKYDSRSNLIKIIDPRENVSYLEYDSAGRNIGSSVVMTDTGDGFGSQLSGMDGEITVVNVYDESGRLISETDDNGNSTLYEYDGLNRIVGIVMPGGAEYSAEYDSSGNIVMYSDARGVVVVQEFDRNNRVVGRIISDLAVPGGIPGAKIEEYAYDGLGRMRVAKNENVKVTREYDSRSNVTKEIQNTDAISSFSSVYDREISYVFDLAGNNVETIYSGGRQIFRAYDELNRLEGLYNDALLTESITEFGYVGQRLSSRIHGNGLETNYNYNGYYLANAEPGDFGFGKVNGITTSKVGTGEIVDSFTFAWDRSQNRVAYKDIGSNMKNRRERVFGYDSASRLVSTDVDFPDPMTDYVAPANNGITTYSLDGAQNRTAVTGFEGSGASIGVYSQSGNQAANNQYSLTPREAGGEWSYVYDLNGNMVIKAQNSLVDYNGDYTQNFFDISAFTTAFNNGDIAADHNGDGSLNFFDISAFMIDFNSVNGADLEHWHYTYDFRNQLVGVSHESGIAVLSTVENTYDPLARRMLETLSGATKQMVYGGVSHWEVIEQIDLSGVSEKLLTTHVYGIGVDDEVSYRIEDIAIPENIWSHRNDMNSLTSISDQNGDIVERYDYGDYGKVQVFDVNGLEIAISDYSAQHLYTGRLLIAGSELYDYRHRVIDSEIGRFVQRDPAGLATVLLPESSGAVTSSNSKIESSLGSGNINSKPICKTNTCSSYRQAGGVSRSEGIVSESGQRWMTVNDTTNRYGYAHSNPARYADPTGETPVALAGCLGGGALSGGFRGLSCWISGDSNCVRKAGCAALGGCIAGAGAGLAGPAGACIGAVLGNAAEMLCNSLGGDPINVCSILDALVGAAAGCIGGFGLDAGDAKSSVGAILLGAFPGLSGGCFSNLGKATGQQCP